MNNLTVYEHWTNTKLSFAALALMALLSTWCKFQCNGWSYHSSRSSSTSSTSSRSPNIDDEYLDSLKNIDFEKLTIEEKTALINEAIRSTWDSYSESTVKKQKNITFNDRAILDENESYVEVKANFGSIKCHYDGNIATIANKEVENWECYKWICFDKNSDKVFYRK